MITLVVTPDQGPPIVPLLRGLLPFGGASSLGVFLLHMAVTRHAEIGHALGFPVFVGDLAFEDGLAERGVRVSEAGRDIFRLVVASRGRVSADRRPMVVYSSRGGQLLETTCQCSGFAQQSFGRRSGWLEVGTHPVGRQLQALDISPSPIMTRCYLNLRIRIPPPKVVSTVRSYRGHDGCLGPTGVPTRCAIPTARGSTSRGLCSRRRCTPTASGQRYVSGSSAAPRRTHG